jgi:peptide/nickel transport system permease protein
MGAYLISRFLQMIPVLWLISTIVFIVFRLVPGDPAMLRLGPEASPESLAALRKLMGIDKSMPQQYLNWFVNMLQGDLGRSFTSQEPVTKLVLQKLPASAELAILGLLIGTLIGVPVGILSAVKQDSWLDNVARVGSLFGFCMPRYWLAILLVSAFSIKLNILPVAGYVPFTEDPLNNLKYALLPALTMGMPIAAVQMRFLRSSMLDTIRADYVRTARAKGLRERIVIMRHALRNALIPFISILGLEAGALLGGSVIIEQIFSWPGIGWLMINSITSRDYPVVQGAVLLSAFVFVVINLLVDVAYSIVDPRIRLGSK